MRNNSDKYPNGRLIVATKSVFATMSARDVARYPQEETEIFGGKILFHIPQKEFDWKSWLVQIDQW